MLFHPIPGTTLLHRMDERLFFGSYLVFQIHLVVSSPPLFMAGVALLLTIGATLGVHPRDFFASIKPLLLVFLFLAAIPPLSAAIGGKEVLPPLFDSSLLLGRLLSLLLTTHLLLGVLHPSGVARTVGWATAPFGSPGETFSFVLVALFALLPRVEELLADQREARLLREPALVGARQRLRLTIYPLLRESLLEADRLTEAFLLRGFTTRRPAPAVGFRTAKGAWVVPAGATLLLAGEIALGIFGGG